MTSPDGSPHAPPRRLRRALVAAACVAAIAGCGKNTGSRAGPQPAAAGPIPIRLAAAERTPVPRKAEFVGSLAGVEQVTISSEVDGTIQKIDVDMGDAVRKGQLLLAVAADEFVYRKNQARADAAQIAAKLGISPESVAADIDATSLVRKALAEFNNSRTDLERRRGLAAKNLIARKEVDDAEARYLVAEANVGAAREEANNLLATLSSKRAQLDLADKKLRDTRVTSPIDGAVEARLVSAGEYIKVGAPLFRIVDDSPIRLVGEVPESFAPALRKGLAVELAVDGRPGKLYRGTLHRISPSANVANRAIQVEAVFPNPSRELRAGFFGKGAILLRVDADAVTIPKHAVVTFAGIDKVFVVQDGKAQERKVKLGDDLGDRIEVAEGVRAGERVAVTNMGKLVQGSAVTDAGGAAK